MLPEEESTIESIRKRPRMYVGNAGFFGFIQYLVDPVSLLLGGRPSRLTVSVGEGEFVVEADVALRIVATSAGKLAPFEECGEETGGLGFDGIVLNALSERLEVEIREGERVETLSFRRGVRESHRVGTGPKEGPRTTLRFAPDHSVLGVASLSPTVFESYLRRLSFLHRGVRFSLEIGGERRDYLAEGGIVDLFDSVAAPYQLLHEPIRIAGEDGPLRLELIFAHQSWTGNALWCFINKGRAVEGGTHEAGLDDALNQLHREWRPPDPPDRAGRDRNGVVGVLSLGYPGVVLEGCLKAWVSNPELRGMVRELVLRLAREWIRDRPEVADQIRVMQRFDFPEIWST